MYEVWRTESINYGVINHKSLLGHYYVNNDNITRANLFEDGLYLLDTGKQISGDNFVFSRLVGM